MRLPSGDQSGSIFGAFSGVLSEICRKPVPSGLTAQIEYSIPYSRENPICLPSGDQQRFFFMQNVASRVIRRAGPMVMVRVRPDVFGIRAASDSSARRFRRGLLLAL